ncbi:hypothetical protein NPIL_516961 [Nephila pilipes]|uniref:Uncharacterized protein n=1 Tax=Nephila pilipes TaxID=299642 RepID=A0A8X6UKK1_NEPPI|nr:hypothetical protein NPIL_516961 [Nephila pilipes]
MCIRLAGINESISTLNLSFPFRSVTLNPGETVKRIPPRKRNEKYGLPLDRSAVKSFLDIPKAPRQRRPFCYLIGHTCKIFTLFTDARVIYHNNERDTCNCVSLLTIGLEKEVTCGPRNPLHFKFGSGKREREVTVEWTWRVTCGKGFFLSVSVHAYRT